MAEVEHGQETRVRRKAGELHVPAALLQLASWQFCAVLRAPPPQLDPSGVRITSNAGMNRHPDNRLAIGGVTICLRRARKRESQLSRFNVPYVQLLSIFISRPSHDASS